MVTDGTTGVITDFMETAGIAGAMAEFIIHFGVLHTTVVAFTAAAFMVVSHIIMVGVTIEDITTEASIIIEAIITAIEVLHTMPVEEAATLVTQEALIITLADVVL